MLNSIGSYAGTLSMFRACFFFAKVQSESVFYFFSCTEPLESPVQVGKCLGDCEAEIEIYSGQVYRNE